MNIVKNFRYQKLKKKLSKLWGKDVKVWGEEEKVVFTLVMGQEFFKNIPTEVMPYYVQCDLILTSAVWATCFHKDSNSLLNDDNYKNEIFELLNLALSKIYSIKKTKLDEVIKARYEFLSRYLNADSDGKAFIEEVGYVLANDTIDKCISNFSENSPLPVLDFFKQLTLEKMVSTYYQMLIPVLVQLFKNPNGYNV